jgi:hypothetical protein
LSYDNLRELIKFAYEEKVVLLADEVYQENIYQDERPFVSARKVMHEMGEPYKSGVELLSFHTVSKASVAHCCFVHAGPACCWPGLPHCCLQVHHEMHGTWCNLLWEIGWHPLHLALVMLGADMVSSTLCKDKYSHVRKCLISSRG